jgi:hypothetical protein
MTLVTVISFTKFLREVSKPIGKIMKLSERGTESARNVIFDA